MRWGIVGLPTVGKTTVFNLLTRSEETTEKFTVSQEAHRSFANVPDRRLEKLRDLYQPRKFVRATVEFIDIPGLERGQGSENADLVQLRDVDALLHVLRDFEDPELLRAEGSTTWQRDLEEIDLELLLADHELVSRRVERLEKSRKRGLSPEEEREEALLVGTILPALEDERPLRTLELAQEDEKRLRGFQLLSAKPLMAVRNLDEHGLAEALGQPGQSDPPIVPMCAPLEAEIADLEGEEAAAFLSEYGLEEPSIDRILRACYELLGLVSFFTVGEDEVRAWTVQGGTVARKAAGTIHSDLERGFIRAEVVPWQELVERGSLSACRDAGVLRLEGKEYVVQDGDVAHFRFNV